MRGVDLKAHLMESSTEDPDVDVIIRGRLLWMSEHQFKGSNLIRLHITDAEHEESYEELMEVSLVDGNTYCKLNGTCTGLSRAL